MTDAETRALITEILGDIAPEGDLGALADEADFARCARPRPMGCLNFIVALHERIGMEIPEADYRHPRSLGAAVAYLEEARKHADPT